MNLALFLASESAEVPLKIESTQCETTFPIGLFTSEINSSIIKGYAAHQNDLFKRKLRYLNNYFVLEKLPTLSNQTFKEHFRITMETFENLRNLWGNSFETSKGRPCCDADRQLLLSLWTLANQESFRGIADRFDVERGLAHRIFTRFVKFIFSKRETFIRFPKGEEQQIHRRSFDLLRVQSFSGVVGCIDGCHIPIKQPMDDPQSYYNRKKFHSVILQGICDAKMQFIDVFVGWPGSSHDAHVWKNSPFFQLIAAEGGNNPMFPADCICVLSNMELLPIVIVAACVLHNLCLLNDDVIEFDEIEEGWDDVNNAEEAYVELLGVQKRDLISQDL